MAGTLTQGQKEFYLNKPNIHLRGELTAVEPNEDGSRAGATDFVVNGARGCFEEKTGWQLYKEEIKLSSEKKKARDSKIIDETTARGHGAVDDQAVFLFENENVTRATTLMLCAPVFASHLQQSLRRASPKRGFQLPESILKSEYAAESVELLSQSFKLYSKMTESGIPAEDARFNLPLATRTNIQTAIGLRELRHLEELVRAVPGIPSTVKSDIEKMVELVRERHPKLMEGGKISYEHRAWLPSPNLFALQNPGMEKLISTAPTKSPASEGQTYLLAWFNFADQETIKRAALDGDLTALDTLKNQALFYVLTEYSVAAFHQATRQRTWLQSVQSIHDAVMSGERITIPPKIAKSELKEAYLTQARRQSELYRKIRDKGIPAGDAALVLPHSITVYDAVQISGWNAIHSLGKRRCTKAQWEIRNRADEMGRLIEKVNPEMGKYAQPQGVTYGRCPERNPCKKCDKILEEMR